MNYASKLSAERQAYAYSHLEMPKGVDVTLPLNPWRPIDHSPYSKIITKTSAPPD